jgi:hypothetical protein
VNKCTLHFSSIASESIGQSTLNLLDVRVYVWSVDRCKQYLQPGDLSATIQGPAGVNTTRCIDGDQNTVCSVPAGASLSIQYPCKSGSFQDAAAVVVYNSASSNGLPDNGINAYTLSFFDPINSSLNFGNVTPAVTYSFQSGSAAAEAYVIDEPSIIGKSGFHDEWNEAGTNHKRI